MTDPTSRFIAELNVHTPICFGCRFYSQDLKCNAFPHGIPMAVITGKVDHRTPIKGDRGITFEPAVETL